MSIDLLKAAVRPKDERGSVVWVYYDGERVGLVAHTEAADDYAINYSLTPLECRALAHGLNAVADVAERDGYIPVADR